MGCIHLRVGEVGKGGMAGLSILSEVLLSFSILVFHSAF